MKPNIQQLDWLDRAEELNDIEASQVNGGAELGSIDSSSDPEAFAASQAEFQAESQIFKMYQEAISTQIKSIGEGMSSVARKS